MKRTQLICDRCGAEMAAASRAVIDLALNRIEALEAQNAVLMDHLEWIRRTASDYYTGRCGPMDDGYRGISRRVLRARTETNARAEILKALDDILPNLRRAADQMEQGEQGKDE